MLLIKSRSLGVFAVVALCLIALLFHKTLLGYYQLKIASWEEEAFVGKPLSDLETALERRGITLEPEDSEIFFGLTHRELSPRQRLYRFGKGRPYPWWLIGTVVNYGVVVTEPTPEGEKIVKVLRAKSVDTL